MLLSYITNCIKVKWNLTVEICTLSLDRYQIHEEYILEDKHRKTEQHSKLRSSIGKYSKEDKAVFGTAVKWIQNEL
jgi:hypothetical protein